MAVFSSDDFVGTNGTELSAYDAKWVKVTGFDLEIQGNRVRVVSSGSGVYRTTDAPASADYSVTATVVLNSTSGVPGASALGRCSNSAVTYYSYGFLEVSAVMGTSLAKRVAGASTSLGRDTTGSYTGTQDATLDMSGTTIRGLINGVQVLTATDSAITAAGFPGISVTATSNLAAEEIESFEADEAGGGGGFMAAWAHNANTIIKVA